MRLIVFGFQFLLSRKAKVNVQNQSGDTPLHKAVWKKHPEACQLLVSAGADTEIANHDHNTPFALARDSTIKRIGMFFFFLLVFFSYFSMIFFCFSSCSSIAHC